MKDLRIRIVDKPKKSILSEQAKKQIIKDIVLASLQEAHTGTLQSYIDDSKYDLNVTKVAKDLVDIVESVEKFFIEAKQKAEKVLEGAGPQYARALSQAFLSDVRNNSLSFDDILIPEAEAGALDRSDTLGPKAGVYAPRRKRVLNAGGY